MDTAQFRALRLKMIGVTLAFSLVPLFALGYVIHTSFSQAYTDKVDRGIRIILEDKRLALDMFLQSSLAQLNILAQGHTFAELSQQERLAQVFRALQANSRVFIDLGVIDAEGNHVAYVGPHTLQGLNYSQERWFDEVMRRGSHVSDVFMGFRKNPHCIMAVLREENGQLWVLRATVDSEVFTSLVRAAPLGRQGEAFLVNSQGVLQTLSFRHGEVLQTAGLERNSPARGVRVQQVDWEGRALLTGTTWLEQANWKLVVQEDTSELMSPLWRTQQHVLVIILAGVAIIIAGCVLTSGNLVARLQQADQEKAAMNAALMQSSKIAGIGKLAAGVAHEVNNPLTLIREGAGWIKDLLAEESPESMKNYGEIEKTIAGIDQHVERARTVTHRLLGFARRMEPMQEHVDLCAIMDQTLSFLESEALYRKITITKLCNPALPSITTDPAQLQQVLLNLMENAIDAIGRDGDIRIQTGQHAGEVWISITDTGPGIPKQLLQDIFDPFFTTKQVGEGTGLGLSISYGIINKMGGQIRVESEEGRGATFTVSLPM